MTFLALPDAAIGPVAAAVVAAVLAFISLVVTKESKVSEFRHERIDGLRADIAVLIANVSLVRTAVSGAMFDDKKELFSMLTEHIIAVEQAGVAVRLRVDTSMPLGKAVADAVADLTSQLMPPIQPDAFEASEQRILEAAKALLDAEWAAVRRGELTFVIVKWSGVLTAALLVGWLTYTVAFPPLPGPIAPGASSAVAPAKP